MNHQDLTGIWDLVETFEGEPTHRYRLEIKETGEILLDKQGRILKGVYSINETGDHISLAIANFDSVEGSVVSYLGDLFLGKIFGRMKSLDVQGQWVNRGTWAAAKISNA